MQTLATLVLAASAATTNIYSDYPGLLHPRSMVQAYLDKGPIVEIVVRCPVGSGILSYSKLEKLYCSSKHDCFRSLESATHDTCR